MKFNTVLPRSDGPGVLNEVLRMTSHASVRATGVTQQGEHHFQFQVELDLPGGEWHMVTSRGEVYSYRDGTVSLPPDPPFQAEFGSGMFNEIRMLYPDRLLLWGRRNESFYPMLAQEIGTHSILLTFEHVEDPAFRATMVIDRRLGVIRKTAMLGDLRILTDVQIDQPMARDTNPVLEPITDWIRADY
ncbi:hypothetical protein J7E25_02780 [Agromyces sp. ISL-38]|uniref:hypothetical protein n=1 Tax=Agromyces sp. ISL-38 TaxID=2819107 RepID=UPI001BE8B5C1|nr:hypothetical protein [Agromyces sp. ISL-38]MBT2498012.1 hypothetical protein [Agromyces sp. ISL-38]